MNNYESPTSLPDCDTRISFAARLRYNSQVHGVTGLPLGLASIAGIIEETIAAERELLRDCDISGKRGLLDLCDFTEAFGLDVKYYDEEYPAVDRSEASVLADKIDVQTCIYVRGEDGESHNFAGPVWLCNRCGHDEGEYGAYFYRHCPICGRKIEKTVG